jgi:FOG: WD40 repeat
LPPEPPPVSAAPAIPKGARLFVLAFLLGVAGLWGWAFWSEKQVRPEGTIVTVDRAPVRSLQFSPDGGSLLISAVGTGRRAGSRGGVQLVRDADRPEGELPRVRSGAFGRVAWRRMRTLRVHRGDPQNMGAAAFSPDGRALVTVSGQVTVWSADTGRAIRTFKAGRRAAAWTPDSRALAWQNDTGDVLIQEVATGRLRLVFRPDPEVLTEMAFTPDGAIVAAHDREGGVTFYDATTGERRAVADAPPALCMALSPVEDLVALGAADGVIRLCDPRTGQVRRTVAPPARPVAPITALAIGPRARLAAGDAGGVARLYGSDAGGPADGDAARAFPHATGRSTAAVRALAFSPRGSHLATGGEDGIVRIWPLRPRNSPN